MPAKYVTVDGTAVHYLHSGPTTLPDVPPALDRGRLFVLVHAAGSNAGMWRRQVEAAAVDDSVVALDLPGHGRSSGVEGLPTLDACAEFVVRFAAALRLRRFVLAGGAVRFPIRDENLAVLRDVVRGRLPQQFSTETFSPATGMDLMREAWTEQVKTDPRVRLTDLLACQGFDGRELLDRIRTPTLVVAGADDQVTPVALAEELARGIREARLEVIPAAGHQAPLEQADRFNRLVAVFAAALP